MSRPSRPAVLVAALLGGLMMAPTPGDIGGCGQAAEELSASRFFASLRVSDCASCERCGVDTATCRDACGTAAPPIVPVFPQDCAPLAHDGEVCLRRLQVIDCDDVGVSLADGEGGAVVPITERPRPGECQFCPAREEAP